MNLRSPLWKSFRQKTRSPDLWLQLALLLCLCLAFWPMTRWVAASAQEQSRLFHALLVLGLATFLLIRFSVLKIENAFELNSPARLALASSFGLLLVTFVARFFIQTDTALLLTVFSLTHIIAYCCGIAAVFLFIFGKGAGRIVFTTTTTFGAFLVLSLFMESLDWPLRNLAGKWSALVLSSIGQGVELGLIRNSEALPMLILLVNEHPFHVASECNGFGVILTSLLLAFLLAIYNRLEFQGFAVNLIAGITLGFIFNTVRIIIIVLLAPQVKGHYDLMHEIVGGLTYWACLVLVWLLLEGPIGEKTDPSDEINL